MNYIPQAQSIAERVNKPVRIVQCVQSLNESEFIGLTLRSIYNEVDRIIIIEGAVANHPKSTPDGHSIDNTVEIIEDFKRNHDPFKKVVFISIKRHWKNLEEIKQTFLDMSSHGDILLINDADEFYMPADVHRIRAFFDLYPHATELIPNFLHFYKDFGHLAMPGAEWNCQHQRIIRYQRGSKYNSHPVLTDPFGQCTYFSPHYQHRRFVPSMPVNIYHYGYARSGMNEIMKEKQEYYEKELVGHNKANLKFDRKVKDWFEGTEPILIYDGEHPEIMKQHPMYGKPYFGIQTVFGDWKRDAYYSKALNGETGNIWLCMNKLAQPYMNFFHNGVDV